MVIPGKWDRILIECRVGILSLKSVETPKMVKVGYFLKYVFTVCC